MTDGSGGLSWSAPTAAADTTAYCGVQFNALEFFLATWVCVYHSLRQTCIGYSGGLPQEPRPLLHRTTYAATITPNASMSGM